MGQMTSGPILFPKIVKTMAIIPKFHYFIFCKKNNWNFAAVKKKKKTKFWKANRNIKLWLSATEVTEKIKSWKVFHNPLIKFATYIPALLSCQGDCIYDHLYPYLSIEIRNSLFFKICFCKLKMHNFCG